MMKTLRPRARFSESGINSILSLSLFISLLLLAAACAQTPTPTVETVEFSVVTDTSTLPLLEELVSVYSAERPYATIRLQPAANGEKALEALRAGFADVASVSWLPEPDKSDGALWYRPIARDSIVVITHPSNPVGGLTIQALRDIYQGQTLSWDELGGLATAVMPVSREDGSGTRQSFEAFVLGRRDVTPMAVVMPSSKAVVEYVATIPEAIGYVATAWLAPTVNLLAVDGATPSPVSVEEGRYILARPYYLVAPTEPHGGLADFVEWIREGDGRTIVNSRYAPAP
jgi:phosphate transport system substrate-binding protein